MKIEVSDFFGKVLGWRFQGEELAQVEYRPKISDVFQPHHFLLLRTWISTGLLLFISSFPTCFKRLHYLHL